MSEPIGITVTRFRCPYCRCSYAKRADARTHMTRCWYNPDTKSCRTCAHYDKEETVYPDEMGLGGEFCDEHYDMRHPHTRYVTQCPGWTPKES